MEIAIVALSVLSLSLLVALSITLKKLKMVSEGFYKLFTSYTTLIDTSDEIRSMNTENAQDIHKENFIKFLSDSREWAYDYIDKVQQEIKNFVAIADKEFAFFDSFGSLTQEYPHHEEMKKISEEYKKLKSLLPEESDDRR